MRWQTTLQLAWTRRGLLACGLWPLSLLYGALVGLRTALYRLHAIATQRVPVPLVVVGNVVTGGVGKTPVVMALVQHWQAQGLQVGVISRGYGRRTQGCFEVTAHTLATDVGDEPSLIQRRTQAPVFVAERRIDAARALLAAYPSTQLIVSDDGLQHLALHRDLNLGVFDDRGVGNGWLLPAGPLREPWPRPLDAVLHTGQHPAFAGFQVQRTLAQWAVRADGSCVALADLAAHATQVTTPNTSVEAQAPLLALAGIAQPEAFFAMLRTQGVIPARTLALSDHADFESALRNEYKGYSLICTEKDAVKLWHLRPDALAVPLHCTLPTPLTQLLDARLATLLTKTPLAFGQPSPLSSPKGRGS
ncbi:tetraacyldisaccharide 4'-kinase [Rhodoferax sp.]|uniref:tetraacyldisaccharide 4'-kinase n=1 Tax=Rhodoferax sp. TaxID=50421 RepID=UPI002636FE2D|nr:tetraacyldisaccharide 4'-kinase [Rhodoferax sp.]MDD4942717.1 tetraacyldisaccharide 4'-kinase [Rhodoferax sp.]MDD5479970.1 tetraacyldisaccharide 4'-kinase [Rhodoferax sp.]